MKTCCGYSLEKPLQGPSNEYIYTRNRFSRKKNMYWTWLNLSEPILNLGWTLNWWLNPAINRERLTVENILWKMMLARSNPKPPDHQPDTHTTEPMRPAESAHDKTYFKARDTREDSDQPAHPFSLIRVFAECMCLLQPLGVDGQDDQSLCLL